MMIGTKLAQYEITSQLGTGGMGEVYQATDSRLGRSVAIKLLPEAFKHDADRAARLEREARVLASLNHPNIATIHGVEECGGRKFLVMELVTGETLAEKIKRGAIGVDESLGIAMQITEALEAAHEKGVIHRDLKPANVKITPEGKVKVLDFGLAKAFSGETTNASLSNSPTISLMSTQHGLILGTAAYMSPEQAKGNEVDRRTDIFAFGAVLFEMLTGHPAFGGEDVSDILSHVLRSDPNWSLLPSNVPHGIRELLKLCLQKDAKKRRQAAGDIRIDIEQVLAEPLEASSAPVRGSRMAWIVAAAALVGMIALAIPALRHLREVRAVAPLITSSINGSEGAAFDFSTTNGGNPALSPDGKWIVYGAGTADNKTPLWIRPLSSTTAQMLAGTDGATFPFWSPDSRYVAFFAGSKLKKIDISGGPPIEIADASGGRGGTWSPSGIILFSPTTGSGPLFKIAENGGTPTRVTSVEVTKSYAHKFPWFLPDGRHFIFEDQQAAGNNDNVLRIGSLDSQETVEIGHASSNAVYSSGYLLFLREDTLMAQPFDPDKRTVQGDAVPVAERVSSILTGGRKGVFTVSSSEMLAYQTGGGTGNQKLSWFDRTGKILGTLGDPGNFTALELSPNRKSAAVSRTDATGNQDIWIYDIAHNLPRHFSFDPGQDRQPIWSPDGTDIVWENQTAKQRLLRKSADGKGTEEVLYEDTGVYAPTSWSPDGKLLLFNKNSTGTGIGVWSLPLVPEKPGSPLKPTALVDTAFIEIWGVFSPDGHWVAYESNESKQQEIYVIPFPGPGGKRQISTAGGGSPRWRRDGKEVFYVGLDGRLMAAEVTLKDSSFEVVQVKPLGIAVPTSRGFSYDVSLDGQRILAITDPERSVSHPLTLLQNWTGILKK